MRDGRAGRIVLALLGIDGVFCALAGALLLPSYIGAVPLPFSALLSGVLNVALVWAAGQWTTSKSLAALPLWTWLATVTALTLGGPGGDVVFGGPGAMAYSVFVLLIAGGLPPVLMLRRMRRLTA